jgi:hypothetical protein
VDQVPKVANGVGGVSEIRVMEDKSSHSACNGEEGDVALHYVMRVIGFEKVGQK